MKKVPIKDFPLHKIDAHAEKWRAIATSTGPSDRAVVASAMAAAYKQAGFGYPKMKWCASPLEGALAFKGTSVADKIWVHEVSRAMSELKEFGGKLGNTLNPARTLVKKTLDPSVGNTAANIAAGVACELVNRSKQDGLPGSLIGMGVSGEVAYRCGTHDALIIGFFDFFREHFKHTRAKITLERLDPLIEISKHCGWWWPCKNNVILTERPTQLLLDADGLLHAEGKPAIEYQDGFSVCAWHGTRVPHDLALTPDAVSWDAIETLVANNKRDERLKWAAAEIKVERWISSRWMQGDRRNVIDLREASMSIFRIGGFKGLAAFVDGHE